MKKKNPERRRQLRQIIACLYFGFAFSLVLTLAQKGAYYPGAMCKFSGPVELHILSHRPTPEWYAQCPAPTPFNFVLWGLAMSAACLTLPLAAQEDDRGKATRPEYK